MVKVITDFPRFDVIQNSYGWRLTRYKNQAVIILPRVENNGLIFVREPRVQSDGELGFTLNLPRGGIESEYTPAENALKELEEKTGVSATTDQVRFLGLCAPDNGSFAVHAYCFEVLLTEEQWNSRVEPREEHLQAMLVSCKEFIDGVKRGLFTDALSSHAYLMSEGGKEGGELNEHFLDVELSMSERIESDDHAALMLLRERLSALCNPIGIPFSTDGATITLCGFLYAQPGARESFFAGIKQLLAKK